MRRASGPADPQRRAEILAELHRERTARQQSYRDRALKILPHICTSCGREFSGKRLRELTVHHKDHDHTHNPPDGSNWELLCIYCHDDEHEKSRKTSLSAGPARIAGDGPGAIATPFDALDSLFKKKEEE